MKRLKRRTARPYSVAMVRIVPLALAATALLVPAPAAAQAAQAVAPFQVEGGRGFNRLQDAVASIGGGSGTILIADGAHRQCAVQGEGRVTYRARTPGRAVFDGVACEGKAALVLRGEAARVEGIVFRGIRVPDLNGAGIRLEKGDLAVVNAMFRDSQQGILSAPDPASTIVIDRSTFSGLGRCDENASCAHSIYIGDYGALTVTRSRFERGMGGHYVKSHAARITVTGCSFDDTRGRNTNYMIDLPSGATGTIADNVFVQGPSKENYSAFVAVAAEGRQHSSAGLSIRDNEARIAPGIDRSTVFVANWSKDRIALGANRLGPRLTPYEAR